MSAEETPERIAAGEAEQAAAAESATTVSAADGDDEPETEPETEPASTRAVPSGATDPTATGPTATDPTSADPTAKAPAPDTPNSAADDDVDEQHAAGPAQDDEPTAPGAVSAPDAEGTPRRTIRRFPLFTRDTARPEGGGRAAPGEAPAPARQWPILVVLAVVGLGLLLTAFDVFRVGLLLIGAAMLVGAVLRWALPDVGMLAVRSRFTDLLTYGVLGIAIVLLAMMAQPEPWLEIPFLDSTLHYTVQ